MITVNVVHVLDLVQGPSLVHYDSMRAFPSRRECKIQTVIKCTHSLSQKTPR